MLQYDVVNPAKWHNYGATVIGSIKLGYSNLYRYPPVEEPENSMGGGHFFQMENSMEEGILGLEIPRRGLKLLTKCWKFHGRG